MSTKDTHNLEARISIPLGNPAATSSVTESIADLLGFKADDFLTGKISFRDRIHADDQDIADLLFNPLSNPASGQFNIRLRQANQRIRCLKGYFTKSFNAADNSATLELKLQDAKGLSQNLHDLPMMSNFVAMMENTDDYIYFKDRNHVFTGASQTLVTITDPSERWTDLLGQTDYDVFPEEYADIYYRLEKQVFAGINVAHEIQRTQDKSGNQGWVDNRKYPIYDANGEIIGLFGIARDITVSKLAEMATAEALSRLTKIASRVPGLVYQFRLRLDGSSCLPYASDAVWNIFRTSPDALQEDASKLFSVIHPDDLEGVFTTIRQSAYNLSLWHHEFRVRYDDGTIRWLLGNSMPEREEAGSTLWNGFITDITDKKFADAELNIAAIAFESQEGMLVTNAKSEILRVNLAFTKITGYTAAEVIGQNPRLLRSHRHDADFYARMWSSITHLGAWEGEIWNRRKNGEVYPEHLTITAVKDKTGEITNYVATLTDITTHKVASEKIKNLAFYDPLTQLPNRRLLLDRLSQALASSARSGQLGAILFLDLDHFKTLNDTLGHDVGDILLQQVAQRLTACLREGDTVARLGGDEFVLLLEDLSEHAIETATKTEAIGNKVLASLNKPYQLAAHIHHSTTSIGATIFNGHALSTDELLKQADIAMYQSKTAGRNALSFFDRHMQDAINSRVAMEADLRNAIEQQQFQLYYQVQVDAAGNPFGAEALIRWLHPDRIIPPGEFIPLAEETGLIVPIGQWVLETACLQLKTWQQAAHTRNLTLSVNVSAKQFQQADFVQQVQSLIKRFDINPLQLKLELTESMLVDRIDELIVAMNALQKTGIKFELDDFGTGYSSLQYLKKLPLYQLKIDQSFVREIDTNNHDRSIVRTVIAMALSLELDVIAEGVENIEQKQILINEGCGKFQGYLFGKPLPLKEFDAFLKSL